MRTEARAAVVRAAATQITRPIRLVAPGGRIASTRGSELRAEPLVDEALDAALERGTVGRVLARVGIRPGPDVDLAYRLAPVPVAKLANRLDRRFGKPWRDAGVEVARRRSRRRRRVPEPGVDRGALRRALRTLPSRVELSIVPALPVVSTAEAEAAAARIERLLDGPRRVRFGIRESTLTPEAAACARAHRARRTARSG